MLSQRHRPAPWKEESARRALDYYRTWWQGHKALTWDGGSNGAFAQAKGSGDGVVITIVGVVREKAFEFVELRRLPGSAGARGPEGKRPPVSNIILDQVAVRVDVDGQAAPKTLLTGLSLSDITTTSRNSPCS